jgi:hypothetical protein
VCIVTGNAVYASDQKECEAGQKVGVRGMEAADGAGHDVGACRMCDDDHTGLVRRTRGAEES